MSNTQKKEKMSVVKKMIIALVGGLVVGLDLHVYPQLPAGLRK